MRSAALALLCLALLAPAYDWPVKPFDVQHPIRGNFDDPRREPQSGGPAREAFHSGIDIDVPDGSPVYAIEAGHVGLRRSAVVVTSWSGHVFGYWHVEPAVAARAWVPRHALLGYVLFGWGHVHLSERVDGEYVNPLRPGALEPYADDTRPQITGIDVRRDGRHADITSVSGTIDLVADVYDTPALAPPAPWQDSHVTPALVRWRLLGPAGVVLPWRIAVDFRRRLLPPHLYDLVFAPGTRENRPGRPGRYCFYLARELDTRALPAGMYVVQVQAFDSRRNKAFGSLPFVLAAQSRKRL